MFAAAVASDQGGVSKSVQLRKHVSQGHFASGLRGAADGLRVAQIALGNEDARRGSGGILRVDFQEPDETLEEIPGRSFDISRKTSAHFLHQVDASGGRKSRLVKFVDRG